MSRDSAEARRRIAENLLATAASTEPAKVGLILTSEEDRRRHQLVRDAVRDLATMHSLLNEAEQARRLAKLATLHTIHGEIRVMHERLAKFTRMMADVVGVTDLPPEES